MCYTFAFEKGTPDGVRKALIGAWMKRLRVRIFYGNTETGEQYLEDLDVIGKVGRSVGHSKVALMVHNSRSLGGGQIDTDRILRITCTKTKRDLYRADNYRMPVLTEYEMEQPMICGADGEYVLTHAVARNHLCHDGEVVARFTSKQRAMNWKAWQLGERMRSW